MQAQKHSDIKNKFLHSISSDSPLTKLWKFRIFQQTHPAEALSMKDKMLQFALKNKLLGQYEAIYALFGVNLLSIPRTGNYEVYKNEMQTLVNKLKVEANQLQQIGKVQEQVRLYFRLGQIYSQYGDHKESQLYYSKILKKQNNNPVIKDQEYLPQWGREVFYSIDSLEEDKFEKKNYQDLQYFSLRVFEDSKKINSTLAFIRDIYKLSNKGKGRGRVKVLENTLAGQFTIHDIVGNKIFSLQDLGLLYTLLSLAYKNRISLKKDIKWSSKLQILFLNADYKKLLQDLEKAYDNYGQFNLTIKLVYRDCFNEIKKRILSQIFDAYHMISAKQVAGTTGLSEIQIERWVKSNSQLNYLWDPTTNSIVYYERTVPLYNEAAKYYRIIKDKFDEKEKHTMDSLKDDIDLQSLMERRHRM